MTRRHLLLLVIVGLAVVCGLALGLSQRKPLARLRIVRFASEQAEPVVFFRVNGPEHRWVAVGHVFKVVGDRVDDMEVKNSDGDCVRVPDFWAPSQQSDPPIGHGGAEKREVGITVPANAPVWKLRVEVDIEDKHAVRMYRDLIRGCASAIFHGRPVAVAFHRHWNYPYDIYFYPEIIESDPITNAVNFAAEATK